MAGAAIGTGMRHAGAHACGVKGCLRGLPSIHRLPPGDFPFCVRRILAMSSVLDSVASAGRLLWRGLVQLVYPNTCWICAQPLAEEMRGFCSACRDQLLSDHEARCVRCAATVGPYVDTERG